jgi:Lrp/AsnC family leucine-responsive transcriptional regulator
MILRHNSVDRDRAEIGLEHVGLSVQALVRIKAPGQGLEKATRSLCSLPEVLECHRATGGDCFVLRVAVLDIKELERLLNRLVSFGNLTTSVISSNHVPLLDPPNLDKRASS